MNKEFIPYEEALALKELGFEEPCLRYYVPREEYSDKSITYVLDWDGINYTKDCKAPLYQQAFRWFREKYNLCGYVRKGNEEFHKHLQSNGFVTKEYEWTIVEKRNGRYLRRSRTSLS
jgi:hypothetical protein